tara:strand:+ start:227 stop:367 length:141 start_codon:yes stop_codon:yes gene_type:complete
MDELKFSKRFIISDSEPNDVTLDQKLHYAAMSTLLGRGQIKQKSEI